MNAFASLLVDGREIDGGRHPCELTFDRERSSVSTDKSLVFPCPVNGIGTIRFFRDHAGDAWIMELPVEGPSGRVVAGLNVSLIRGVGLKL